MKFKELIVSNESRWLKLNKANSGILDWEQELMFACQQILKNSFTSQVAQKNQVSALSAVLNASAIGISLNPAKQHAYLVPRDGAICLDISFKGLVHLATDAGAIEWAKVELVYANDQFTWRGPAEAPIHHADVFGDRGEIVGGYCIAKLPSGEIMTEVMKVDEINKIRDTSKAFQKGGGPWKDWYEEMAKKTIMKRAAKNWPQNPNRNRVDQAIENLNQHEGTAYTIEQHVEFYSMIRANDCLGLYLMSRRTEERAWVALYNSFEAGQKTSGKKNVNDMLNTGFEKLTSIQADLVACIEANDVHGIQEIVDSFSDQDAEIVLSGLTPEQLHNLQQVRDAA